MIPGIAQQKSAKAQSHSTSRLWEALTPSLTEWILDAVSSIGLHRMTPVQASTIPLFLGNKDVVVEAVTSSGKTLAFLIPVVERLLRLEEPIKKHHIGAIIVSPTRELATQIHTVLLSLLAFHAPSAAHLRPSDTTTQYYGDEDETIPTLPVFPPSTLRIIPQLLLGGTTTTSQDLAHFLRNSPNLLISTPGRLLELLSSPHVHCPQSSFEVLVLDEADRLLDLGFKEDLQKILQRLPKQRRTGLFSASVSEAVDQLVRVGLRNPVRIAVKVRSANGAEDGRTPASLQMTYLTTPPTHKLPALLTLLTTLQPRPQKTIAYVSTCAAVDYFQHLIPTILPCFPSDGPPITIIPLHGKHSPTIRQKNFLKFTTTSTPTLLLTTDVAARGLDIPSVDLTIQLDPPSEPKTFLHRAGRAGRAGRRGLAVVFLLPGRETDDYVSFLSVRKTPVTPLAHRPISDSDASRCITRMRAEIRKDRALHDKGQRAFVSWVRSYSKHTASSIFRVQDLAWRELGEAWALLRLPRMPELKRARAAGTWDGDATLGVEVDWEGYAYRDKEREKKRRAEMQMQMHVLASAAQSGGDGASVVLNGKERKRKRKVAAWSDKAALHDVKEVRRAKKQTRRESERMGLMTEEERRRERELKGMIEEVRRRGPEPVDDEFVGFGD